MRLSGRVVLVTGGGGGLGRAMAEGFAREGAAVAVTDVNLDGARSVAKGIEERGGQGLALAMDVTSETQVDQGVAETVRALGRLDVVVSNAGVQHIAPITEFALADWRRVLAIHLDGGFLLTRAAMRHWQSSGKGGLLLYMGSVHSVEASPLKSAYVAAKHGLLGLARAAAKEGAKLGVRTNVICPGFVRTPLVEKQIPEQAKTLGISEDEVVKKVMLGNTVDGEFTTLQDIAQLAVDLAAFPSAALTGQLVVASHGWHMH
ncbi:MAG TPA: 3-hydroxybutyrate dehydrogenase [Myxococcaceae bacterium]|nr:3-hydroxybutyrate dehydrogenase [Myxococcaceae bacterium]